MNSSRHINTSLFVTVISACLGLLIVGVPVEGQVRRAADIKWSDKAPAGVKSLLNNKAFISPLASFVVQAQKIAAAYNPHSSFGSYGDRSEPVEISYQNSKALVRNNQVLIVTRLPRAGLSDSLAKSPAAN